MDVKLALIGILTAFISMYSAMAAPKLPDAVIHFFDSTVGRFFFLMLIAVVSSVDFQTGFVVAVGYLILFAIADGTILSETFVSKLQVDAATDGSDSRKNDLVSQVDAAVCTWLNTLPPSVEKSLLDKQASLVIKRNAAAISEHTKSMNAVHIKAIASKPALKYRKIKLRELCAS